MHPRRNRGFAESVRFRRAPADFVFCAARIDEYLIDVGRGTTRLVGKEELDNGRSSKQSSDYDYLDPNYSRGYGDTTRW